VTTLMGRSKARFVAFAVLPATAVALGAVAGVLQWQIVSYRETASAVGDSVQAARSTAARILSYQADTVEQDLTAARDHLTGPFLDSYTELVNSAVIPAARERQISAVAEVVAAASVSATPEHAVALLFINQITTVGREAPTPIPSTVRVTLDNVDGRWLVSGFDPV
jgi:Mce-associated membrane protein